MAPVTSNIINEQEERRCCPRCDKISEYSVGNCRSCGHDLHWTRIGTITLTHPFISNHFYDW